MLDELRYDPDPKRREQGGRVTMNDRRLYQTMIPAAGILYVIVGILAHRGIVWVIGALVVGLVSVVVTGLGRGR